MGQSGEADDGRKWSKQAEMTMRFHVVTRLDDAV